MGQLDLRYTENINLGNIIHFIRYNGGDPIHERVAINSSENYFTSDKEYNDNIIIEWMDTIDWILDHIQNMASDLAILAAAYVRRKHGPN